MKKHTLFGVAIVAMLAVVLPAHADVTVTVDPGYAWVGYMNWFETPENGGAFAGGGVWGTADLSANFGGSTLVLGAAPMPDPATPYWYVSAGGPGVLGNKIMEANMYVEDAALAGQTVTFQGHVAANTLVDGYSSVAFIKDFAPDYSSFNLTSIPMTAGDFSITMVTDPTPGRHVQFGFGTTGRNVWPTDVDSKGNVLVTAPEPTSLVLLLGCAGGVLLRRRS